MAYKAPREKQEKIIKASIEYKLNNKKSVVELEKAFNLPKNALRSYLISEGLLKNENKYNKTRLKDELKQIETLTTQADKRIMDLKGSLPLQVVENASELTYNLTQKGEELKKMMIENAIFINERLREMIPNLTTPYDLKEASQTLKNLNDTAGLFPRAPMVAIQNNLTTTAQRQAENERKKENKLNVNVKFISVNDEKGEIIDIESE